MAFCSFAIRMDTGGICVKWVLQQTGLAAIAVVGQQFRLVADADLPHLDPRLELAGQGPDQLAEIDPCVGQVVDHYPFAAEKMFHVDQLHLQAELSDLPPTYVELGPALLLEAPQLAAVFGGHFAKDLAGAGAFQVAQNLGRGLAKNLAGLQAAVGRNDVIPR